MNKIYTIVLALALLPASALANHRDEAYARVMDVTPNYVTEVRYERRYICNGYYESDNHSYRDHDGRDVRNGVVGAIVGAAVGRQFGDGDGRTAATIGGAVVGAAIGATHDRGRYDDYRGHDRGRHHGCYTREIPYYYRHLRGYIVEYRYEGRYGRILMDEPPYGEYIRIR